MEKTPLMQLIEIRQGRSIEELLREGIEAGLSWTEIARRLGIPYATMNDWRRHLKARVVSTLKFPSSEEMAQ